MPNCPKTGIQGKRVDTATIKTMMSDSLRNLQDDAYYFCADEDCEVVYFNEAGLHLILEDSIREVVYQKSPDNPQTKICYCFQHTVGDIQQAITENTQDTILEDINAGIQQEHCACDWRNPQGTCCLGNVRQLIKTLELNEM